MTTTTTNAGSTRSEYFKRRADTLRSQLIDAEDLLTRRRSECDEDRRLGKRIPREVLVRLATSERKVRELRQDMLRALFNAGRS